MLIHEFRVPLHMDVSDFQVAQLFMVISTSEEQTGNGEGVEVLRNEPYDNSDGHMPKSTITGWDIPHNKGQYTLKKYHLASKFPSYLHSLCPGDSLFLYEEAWNSYPHCVTVLVNGYFDIERFFLCIETMHLQDNGKHENALQLNQDEISQRNVETIDIIKPTGIEERDEKFNPNTFKSVKTGRGPLTPGWHEKHNPVMTCYKLVRTNFQYWGFQTKVESELISQVRLLFHATMREAQCLTDEWHGLTMEDIRDLEVKAQKRLDDKRLKDAAIE